MNAMLKGRKALVTGGAGGALIAILLLAGVIVAWLASRSSPGTHGLMSLIAARLMAM